MTALCLVGGGRMGSALVEGLLASGTIEPGELVIAEKDPSRRQLLAERFGGVEVTESPVSSPSVLLAVKPGDARQAAASVAAKSPRRVLSIMAGVKIAELESLLGENVAVLRAMSNLPAIVGAAASALSGGESAAEADFSWGEGVLSSVGTVVRVKEELLDVVTGLSGSGPAYLFLLAEAMTTAATALGLGEEVAAGLVSQTLLGAARLLVELGEPAAVLRAEVTSPGGTTEAAIKALVGAGVPRAVERAVAAATARSRQLGSS